MNDLEQRLANIDRRLRSLYEAEMESISASKTLGSTLFGLIEQLKQQGIITQQELNDAVEKASEQLEAFIAMHDDRN